MQHTVHKAAVQYSEATHIEHGLMKVCVFLLLALPEMDVFSVNVNRKREGEIKFLP